MILNRAKIRSSLLAAALIFESGCALTYNKSLADKLAAAAAAAAAAAKNVTTTSVVVQGVANVAPIYPINGAGWLDYVINSGGGGTAYTRTDTPCVGTESSYFGCIHGGEKRKFAVTGQTSCTGLTAADLLGVFDWVCDGSQNPVVFNSRGLKVGKGLRNLIDATGWLPNRVTVSKSGSAIFQTPLSNWYSNTISYLTSNGLAISLNPNTIYVASTDITTNGLSISNNNATNGGNTAYDKIGLVTLGTHKITYDNNAVNWCIHTSGDIGAGINKTVLCTGAIGGRVTRFHWIEASINANGAVRADSAIELGDNLQMTRFHRTEVQGYGINNGFDSSSFSDNAILWDYSAAHDGGPVASTGWWITGGSNNMTVMNSVGANNPSQFGITFWAAPGVVMYQNATFNNGSYGMTLGATPGPFSIVGLTTFANSDNGLTLDNSGANSLGTVLGVTTVNNDGTSNGLEVGSASSGLSLNNLFVSGGANGLKIGSAGAVGNTVRDIMATYSGNGINIANSKTNIFSGDIRVGHNTTNCATSGTITGTNLAAGATCTYGGVTPAVTTTADPTTSFVGITAVTDSTNTTSPFSSPIAFTSITDWFNFDSIFRGWGAPPATTFLASGSGACASGGNCQLYDWSLKTNDNQMRNIYLPGSFTAGGPCPPSVDASVASHVITDFSGRKFLLSAYEIMDPSVNPNGNYNGLCESNEACVFAPNIGAYQGSGDYTSLTCGLITPGNGVTNVTMYAYPIN